MPPDELPLVSCLMPTYNRRAFLPHAIRYFLRQDYPHKELIILDDGPDSVADLIPDHPAIRYSRLPKKITLGAKLNRACELAHGPVLALWDDDDWYAPRRLSYQVGTLQTQQTDVCGISTLLYFDLVRQIAFRYVYPPDQPVWISSLCFARTLWQRNPFSEVNVGMDGLFIWATPPDRITVLPDPTISVHIIHGHNVSPKQTSGAWWHPHPVDDIEDILQADMLPYCNGLAGKESPNPEPIPERASTPPAVVRDRLAIPARPVRNVYACLVHERPDCVLDLVRNLHHLDPASPILLYNGGQNPQLLKNTTDWELLGAVLHPAPRPQQHGYLHQFALDCMAFAADALPFDALTIVDSDQLAIRSGYPSLLESALACRPGLGLLSNRPERLDGHTTDIWPVTQAFREYDLWKPWLRLFPDGENQFVHWSFWPSTVFTADASRDLVRLFRDDARLQQIMDQTNIWATEEIILPTLVRLLGYDIGRNPGNDAFVQYKKSYSPASIDKALDQPDAYWIHPIARQYDDPPRSHIRHSFQGYTPVTNSISVPGSGSSSESKPAASGLFLPLSVLNRVRDIEGWLTDAEADLLLGVAIRVCHQCTSEPPILVEVGSYHGKATVLLGSVAQALCPAARLLAIDPHDGLLGATDRGLTQVLPSLASLRANLAKAELTGLVKVIQSRADAVVWRGPVALLLIDGLHDYAAVAQDFGHFSPNLQPGSYILFHDYADYFPGVRMFVDELLATKTCTLVEQADSLVVLQLLKTE